MTDQTVQAGGYAACVWQHDANLDVGTLSLTITAAAGGDPEVGPTSVGVGACGDGLYTYVWQTTAATTAGTYEAVLSGEIEGETVSETVTVTVTSGYPYTSLTIVKEELGIASTSTGHDASLTRWINWASRGVESACDGRRFYRDGATSSRTYFPNGRVAAIPDVGEVFLIDDLATETGLVVEVGTPASWAQLTVAGSIGTYPDNAIARGRPIEGLVYYSGGSWRGLGMLQVTGEWGWPAIPDLVDSSSLLQVMRWFNRRHSPEGIAGSAEWGGALNVPRVDPDIERMLLRFRRPVAGG
jgi:hypothetical protein